MKILILAAGKSQRFANIPKIFANFWGTRVIDLIVEQTLLIGEVELITNNELYDQISNQSIKKLIQPNDGYGTGYAVQSYLAQSQSTELLILPSDIPLIDSSNLEKFKYIDGDVVIGIMKNSFQNSHYGRIITEDGRIVKIAEYKDHEKNTAFVNTGIMRLSEKALHLISLLKQNKHGETYLTDIVQLANLHELQINSIELEAEKAIGFNTSFEFHEILMLAQNQWRTRSLQAGAILFDPNSVFFNYDTQVESGVIIEPNCFFSTGVHLKTDSIIRANSYLKDCIISGEVGPFAYIRSGIINQSRVGAFVEIKNSTIEKGAKIKHLAYIGDTEIESDVNIGAGVVICNYDGHAKYSSKIKTGAFIGANSSLIAPITIGQKAFLAAGGTYNRNVEDNEFAIARAKQIKRNK